MRFEAGWLVPELGRSLLVERIGGIGLDEEENKPENDRVDAEYGLPVSSENVQAHIAFGVNVWMVDRRVAVDLGRLVRIRVWDLETERVRASLPHATGIFFG